MPNDPSDFDAVLEQFRREFIETTSERLNTVDDLITAMMEDNQAEEALAEFLRHVHSIKGQGTTFDFPAITTVAHRLEDYIETAPDHSNKHWKDIQFFVDVMRRIVESGVDPDEKETANILNALPMTAIDFSEVEAFDGRKPIQEVQMLLVMPKGTQRKIVGKELAACGFQISNADTPVDAIKYAVENTPDIIIASRVMEQMGGRELARVFENIEAIKDCKIVIATATGEKVSDLTDMPQSTRVIKKGPDFIDELTDSLDEWGFFG